MCKSFQLILISAHYACLQWDISVRNQCHSLLYSPTLTPLAPYILLFPEVLAAVFMLQLTVKVINVRQKLK